MNVEKISTAGNRDRWRKCRRFDAPLDRCRTFSTLESSRSLTSLHSTSWRRLTSRFLFRNNFESHCNPLASKRTKGGVETDWNSETRLENATRSHVDALAGLRASAQTKLGCWMKRAVRDCDYESVQGRHRQLSERDYGSDDHTGKRNHSSPHGVFCIARDAESLHFR